MENQGSWHVRFTLSGGLGGLRKTVELSSMGRCILEDHKKRERVTVDVAGEEMARIARLLAVTAQLQPIGQNPACADCYHYQLDIQVDRQGFAFQANDLNLEKSGLVDLVKALLDLQQRVAQHKL